MNENQQQIKSDKDQVEIATIKNLENSTPDLIYRGYDNLFEIKVNDLNAEYNFNCTNCSVLKTILNDTLAPFVFAIRTQGGIENPAELTINNDIGDTSVFQFQKANLPQQIIYFNDQTNEDQLDLKKIDSTVTLRINYPPEITLKNEELNIFNWEIVSSEIPHEIGKGMGCQLSTSAIDKIKKLKSGSELSILCVYGCKDSVFRKKIVVFIIK